MPRILRIDTAAARALPGVHAVLTHADVPGDPRHGLVENDWPVFAGGEYARATSAIRLRWSWRTATRSRARRWR